MTTPEIIAAGLVCANIFFIEALLSIDNAAVLAGMVKDLPKEQSDKALKYGIGGAIVFRGLALLFVNFLVKIIWLKIAAGAYLLYLSFDFFYGLYKKRKALEAGGEQDEPEPNALAKWAQRAIGGLWGTIAMVEIMDIAFSVDNVFAAVALTKNMTIVIVGVIFGIIAMRYVAQGFVVLMQKYPFLENITFVIISLLGIKLMVSGAFDYQGPSNFKTVLNSHLTDMLFSIGIVVIFAVPVFFAWVKAKRNPAPQARFIMHSALPAEDTREVL